MCFDYSDQPRKFRYHRRHPMWWHHYKSGAIIPRTRWNFDEEKNEYSLYVELPGVEKKNINLRANDESLRLKAEKEDISEENKELSFERTFYFKRKILPSKISASYKNGELTLTIPVDETEPSFENVSVD
jgi:HSP20 family protein